MDARRGDRLVAQAARRPPRPMLGQRGIRHGLILGRQRRLGLSRNAPGAARRR